MATKPIPIPNSTPRPTVSNVDVALAIQQLATTTLDPLLQAVALLQQQVKKLGG